MSLKALLLYKREAVSARFLDTDEKPCVSSYMGIAAFPFICVFIITEKQKNVNRFFTHFLKKLEEMHSKIGH